MDKAAIAQLEATWDRQAAANPNRMKDSRHLGVTTTSLAYRIYNFYADLVDYISAFWSQSIKWQEAGPGGHLSFLATGPNATLLTVTIWGSTENVTKDIGVYLQATPKDGEGHGDNTWLKFSPGNTVQFIVEGVNKAAVKMTKGW